MPSSNIYDNGARRLAFAQRATLLGPREQNDLVRFLLWRLLVFEGCGTSTKSQGRQDPQRKVQY